MCPGFTVLHPGFRPDFARFLPAFANRKGKRSHFTGMGLDLDERRLSALG